MRRVVTVFAAIIILVQILSGGESLGADCARAQKLVDEVKREADRCGKDGRPPCDTSYLRELYRGAVVDCPTAEILVLAGKLSEELELHAEAEGYYRLAALVTPTNAPEATDGLRRIATRARRAVIRENGVRLSAREVVTQGFRISGRDLLVPPSNEGQYVKEAIDRIRIGHEVPVLLYDDGSFTIEGGPAVVDMTSEMNRVVVWTGWIGSSGGTRPFEIDVTKPSAAPRPQCGFLNCQLPRWGPVALFGAATIASAIWYKVEIDSADRAFDNVVAANNAQDPTRYAAAVSETNCARDQRGRAGLLLAGSAALLAGSTILAILTRPSAPVAADESKPSASILPLAGGAALVLRMPLH